MKIQLSVALEENDAEDFEVEVNGVTLTPTNGVVFVPLESIGATLKPKQPQ